MATTLLLSSPLHPHLQPLHIGASRSSGTPPTTTSIDYPRPICLLVRGREPVGLGIPSKRSRLWRVWASSGEVLAPETVVEKTREIVPVPSSGDGGVGSAIISGLLTIAFVGLTILTVGVVYIAVTDFLQKRERDKFEKEEAANKKKGKKKVKVKARTGPRGFGQKIDDDEDVQD